MVPNYSLSRKNATFGWYGDVSFIARIPLSPVCLSVQGLQLHATCSLFLWCIGTKCQM